MSLLQPWVLTLLDMTQRIVKCGQRNTKVRDSDNVLQCEACNRWLHVACGEWRLTEWRMTDTEGLYVAKEDPRTSSYVKVCSCPCYGLVWVYKMVPVSDHSYHLPSPDWLLNGGRFKIITMVTKSWNTLHGGVLTCKYNSVDGYRDFFMKNCFLPSMFSCSWSANTPSSVPL